MATQAERREATRGRLVDAAARLFVGQGYDDAGTEDVLREAGVSRGALYHHFPAKQDLFEAVFERVSRGAIDRALVRSARSGRRADHTERLILGCLAWLDEAMAPEVTAILLDQGPQVLGWVRAREIENKASVAVMRSGLEAAVEAGEIELDSVDLTAGILNAALAEAALAALHDPSYPGRRRAEKTIRRLIDGLRV